MATYWENSAHSAYDMFSCNKYLIVNLLFSPPRFLEWESFFLFAPFLDHCLLVPFYNVVHNLGVSGTLFEDGCT